MIFVTVGSHEPFDRFVRAVDAWAETHPQAKVFGQITERANYKPKHFPWVGHLPPGDYLKTFSTARLLVSHAGMGSIITAMQYRIPIVIMPRRAALHEMRNDHQWGTARNFKGKPLIHVAEDEVALPQVIDSALNSISAAYPEEAALAPFAPPPLIEFLRAFIHK